MTPIAPDRWTGEQLDAWRAVADEPADEAVAAYFRSRSDDPGAAPPMALLASMVEHTELPPEDRVPEIADFLANAGALPSWADDVRIARGQALFSDHFLHQFTALYLASLPAAYAAAEGVHVLWLTARLRDDPERRLNETAQFLMDVTAPGGFEPGGHAISRVLHVRLMHAGVRWLIDHDPRVEHPSRADPAAMPTGPLWSPSWGRPLNQEDLAGTMLTFTTVVFEALARSGEPAERGECEDYLHLWTVIAHLLGVRAELLPRDLDEARALQGVIFGRQQRGSAVGAALTGTLLDVTRRRLPRPAAGLAPVMIRRYVGDEVADMIAVPRGAAPHRAAFAVLVAADRFVSWMRRHLWRRGEPTPDRSHRPVPPTLSARVGRRLLDGVLAAGRGGDRAPFSIPDHLRNDAG